MNATTSTPTGRQLPPHLSDAGRRAWRLIAADPASALVCSDFDGVLSPIVLDPDSAWADPAAVDALGRLGAAGAHVAVVTGRMARKAVQLGRLEGHAGLGTMRVLGLYGAERWDAATGTFSEPEPPAGIATARAQVPGILAGLGLSSARVEDKRLSLGVHTRELPDPDAALATLDRPLRELAARTGLHVEPGRQVIELRAPGSDKGTAVRALVGEFAPRAVVFAGDDLGDVPAFEAVRALRDAGRLEGLLIASASAEQDALVHLADVVVDGPRGVAALLNQLADAVEQPR